jgi:hypothetical protein
MLHLKQPLMFQLERRAAREELRERGTINDERWRQRGLEDVLGDMKPIQPTSSFFKESKPDVKDAKDVKGKAYTEFDDEDFKPEHLVKMNYFEKQMVAKRYMVGMRVCTQENAHLCAGAAKGANNVRLARRGDRSYGTGSQEAERCRRGVETWRPAVQG